MMTTTADEALRTDIELNEALSKVETALLTPVVSGELESWARNVQEAAGLLGQRMPAYLNSVLHPLYAQIAKDDAELLTRVEQLVAEDQSLLLEQEAFEQRAAAFAKRTANITKDEAKVSPDRDRLEQDGIALVLHIKRQRAAADTWLAEANYRDRGPVD